MPKKPAEQNAHVTPEEFVRIWQTSDSAQEVAAKIGSTVPNVSSRACQYRKQMGIPLKKMSSAPHERIDRAALAELARSLAPKEE